MDASPVLQIKELADRVLFHLLLPLHLEGATSVGDISRRLGAVWQFRNINYTCRWSFDNYVLGALSSPLQTDHASRQLHSHHWDDRIVALLATSEHLDTRRIQSLTLSDLCCADNQGSTIGTLGQNLHKLVLTGSLLAQVSYLFEESNVALPMLSELVTTVPILKNGFGGWRMNARGVYYSTDGMVFPCHPQALEPTTGNPNMIRFLRQLTQLQALSLDLTGESHSADIEESRLIQSHIARSVPPRAVARLTIYLGRDNHTREADWIRKIYDNQLLSILSHYSCARDVVLHLDYQARLWGILPDQIEKLAVCRSTANIATALAVFTDHEQLPALLAVPFIERASYESMRTRPICEDWFAAAAHGLSKRPGITAEPAVIVRQLVGEEGGFEDRRARPSMNSYRMGPR